MQTGISVKLEAIFTFWQENRPFHKTHFHKAIGLLKYIYSYIFHTFQEMEDIIYGRNICMKKRESIILRGNI